MLCLPLVPRNQMPITKPSKNNETEFKNGFGGDDGSGRQQRTIDADTVQCSRVSMVKNGALTNKIGPRKSTRHVTFKEEAEQGKCKDTRRSTAFTRRCSRVLAQAWYKCKHPAIPTHPNQNESCDADGHNKCVVQTLARMNTECAD